MRALGWAPRLTIRESIVRTLDWLEANDYAWREQVAATAALG